jgi:hypothetical protein
MDRVFKALADSSRRKLLDLLSADNGRTLGDLSRHPVPIHEIYERWIGKFERSRLRALYDLKEEMEKDHEK